MSEDVETTASPNHVASPSKTLDRKLSVKERSKKAAGSSFQNLQKDDLIHLLCILESEVQARDLIIRAIIKGEIGSSLPLSHLLGDGHLASVVKNLELPSNEDEDEVWLGEPTAHLNHVVAYHQFVREQMQAMLQDQHKTILRQLEDERKIHAIDTAQGDQVTYMLEKDRERLTSEIEFQQTKLTKAEKERDRMMVTLERVREEQQNEFQLLVNDCKMFAKQLIEQAQKEEQLVKEIEQEKRKNRVLSELMVEEQKRFKERLKRVDEERVDHVTVELDRVESLKQRLIECEEQAKDSHQKYLQESHRVKQLELENKQLKLRITSGDSYESGENSDEFVYDGNFLPPAPDAKICKPNKMKEQTAYDDASLAEMQIATKTTTHDEYPIPLEIKAAVKTASNVSLKAKHANVTSSPKSSYKHSPSSSPKMNRALAGVSQSPTMVRSAAVSSSPPLVRAAGTSSSPKTVRTAGVSSSPTMVRPAGVAASPTIGRAAVAASSPKLAHVPIEEVNKNKKIPPPTPPRVSSITSKSVPVLPSDIDHHHDSAAGNFARSFSVGAASDVASGTIERRQTVSGSPKSLSVPVAVGTGYGWEFSTEDGLVMSNSILDFIGETQINPDTDWMKLTDLVKMLFVEKSHLKFSRNLDVNDAGSFYASINRFELGTTAWTTTGCPAGITPWIAATESRSRKFLIIRLKDETTTTFDSVAYSTSVPNTSLQEYCRLIKRYKNVLFLADDILEAKHFISCFSNWLKTVDELRGSISFVASVEENEICSPQEFIKLLKEYGALVESNQEKPKSTTIILIDVDFVISQKLSSDIFVWLGKRGSEESFYIPNGMGVNSQQHFLQSDVIVLAYATRPCMDHISQATRRLFKLIDLPITMPFLLQRWLRQKAMRNLASSFRFKEIENWSSWISDVYRRSRTDLEKLNIKLEMPDLGLFLSAPINKTENLKSWAEDLWHHHFLPQIESSVEEQVADASNTQQDLLVQVALRAFLEGAFMPGCPCRLDIE